MGSLRTLPPAFTTLKPKIGYGRDKQGHSRVIEPWRNWFNLKRWKDLRIATFVRDLFTCRKCGRLEGDTSQLVGDHIEPHRGDPVLFWDPENIQTLCKPCHDKVKQAEERAAQRGW